MPTALFTLPSFDMPSRWGTSFFNRYILPRSFLIPFIRTGNLYRSLDNRKAFSAVNKVSNFITGVGHGDPTTFTGQNKQVLWKVGQYNPSECEGKVIKLLSCLCGKELGPDLIRNGARAFQGYTELFGWFVDNKYVLTPWRDPVASKFIKPVIEGVKAFLSGKTNREVYEIEYELHTKNAEKEEDPEQKAWMLHNRNSLIILGEPEARIRE